GPSAVAPVVSGFAPSSGAVGSTVTISGVGFTGGTAVSLCFVDAGSFHFVNDTTVTATVPAGACDGRWRITTPAGTAASDGAYTVNPRSTACTPTTPAAASTVTSPAVGFTGA